MRPLSLRSPGVVRQRKLDVRAHLIHKHQSPSIKWLGEPSLSKLHPATRLVPAAPQSFLSQARPLHQPPDGAVA
jgi:hypothetical protein